MISMRHNSNNIFLGIFKEMKKEGKKESEEDAADS